MRKLAKRRGSTRAVARLAKPDARGPDRASTTFVVVMARAQLEALPARTIRVGKSLHGLVNERLAATADESR